MDKKQIITAAVVCIVCFGAGFITRAVTHKCPVPEATVETKIQYQDKVKTEIAYVPKETIIYKNADGSTGSKIEDTDMDVNIAKSDLNVKLNGKAFKINKTSDEKYLFEKNKVALTQTSQADINIKVPTIDNTRKWEIGIGASKNGAAGMIGFPVKSNVGCWVSGDRDTVMAGVSVKF